MAHSNKDLEKYHRQKTMNKAKKEKSHSKYISISFRKKSEVARDSKINGCFVRVQHNASYYPLKNVLKKKKRKKKQKEEKKKEKQSTKNCQTNKQTKNTPLYKDSACDTLRQNQ